MESIDDFLMWRSTKVVRAARIAEPKESGCWVEGASGVHQWRAYDPGMTARYLPEPGDWWMVYEDGYQSISPKHAFEAGYVRY